MTHRQDDEVGLLSVLSLCGLEDHLPRVGEVAGFVLAGVAELDEGELEGRSFDSGHGGERRARVGGGERDEVGVGRKEGERSSRPRKERQQAISGSRFYDPTLSVLLQLSMFVSGIRDCPR